MAYFVSSNNKDVIRDGLILIKDRTVPLSSISSIRMWKSRHGAKIGGLLTFMVASIVLIISAQDHSYTERIPWFRYILGSFLAIVSVILIFGKATYFLKLEISGSSQNITFMGSREHLLEIKGKIEKGLSSSNNRLAPSLLG